MPPGRGKKRPISKASEQPTTSSPKKSIKIDTEYEPKSTPQHDAVEEEFIEVEYDDTPSTSAITKIEERRPQKTSKKFPRLMDSKTVEEPMPSSSKKKSLGVELTTARAPRTRAAAMHEKMVAKSVPLVNDAPDDQPNVHDMADDENSGQENLLCGIENCDSSFAEVYELCNHLVSDHKMSEFRLRKQQFDSIDKFEDWRLEAEKSARCTFFAVDEPEGESDALFSLTMYCEFCYLWRKDQNNQGEKKMACPAYFTATIDNKKNKATVTGCFAHLAHQEKPSENATRNVSEGNSLVIHCMLCDKTFRTTSAMNRHLATVHLDSNPIEGSSKPSEPKAPSLECGDANCDVICDTMTTLVDHVSTCHKRADLKMKEYSFRNVDEFEEWKTRIEADTCSRFTKVSGRDMPNETTKYYLCHLSGHPNRARKPKPASEKIRNRGTKKLGRYCTAHMSWKLNKLDGSILVRGCLGHFGHTFDVRRLPLTDSLRKDIADFLLKGYSEDAVVQSIRNDCDENQRGFWLQRYEVRNIALKLQREGRLIPRYYMQDDIRDWGDQFMPEEGPTEYLPISRSTKPQTSYKKVTHRVTGTDEQRIDDSQGNQDNKQTIVPVDFVDYGDGRPYAGEEAVIEGEDIQVVMRTDHQHVYYEDYDEDGNKIIVPVENSQRIGPRRIPILKEPTATGNPDFDSVMQHIKERIDSISNELKVTRDVAMAESLLKQLKTLEGRLVENVPQTTVPEDVIDIHMSGEPSDSQWVTETYYDYADDDVNGEQVEDSQHDGEFIPIQPYLQEEPTSSMDVRR